MRGFLFFALFAVPIAFGGCAHTTTSGTAKKSNSNCNCNSSQKYEANKLIPIKRLKPNFSHNAFSKGIYGCVTVVFDVNPQGHPTHVTAWASVPTGAFNSSAIATVEKWRFRSTLDGKPAWSYDVFQRIDFVYGMYETSRQKDRVDWLCQQPPPRAVLVRPQLSALNPLVAIANSGGETIAYLPPESTKLLPGSAKIKFCVSHEGTIENATIQREAGPYGLLGVSTLQAWPFTPFSPDGNTQKACKLTWSIPFVTRPLKSRFSIANSIYGIHVSLLQENTLSKNAKAETNTSQKIPAGKTSVGYCLKEGLIYSRCRAYSVF